MSNLKGYFKVIHFLAEYDRNSVKKGGLKRESLVSMSCKEKIKFIQRALSGNSLNVKLRALHNFLDIAVGDMSFVSPFSRLAFLQTNRSTYEYGFAVLVFI